MNGSGDRYTYRHGERLRLEKEPDRLLARVPPARLREVGCHDVEPVSSQYCRARAPRDALEKTMERLRREGATHHAYRLAESGDEFLITDRVLVRFREGVEAREVDRLAGEHSLVLRERYSERDFLYQLTGATGMNPLKLVVRLTERDPRVEAAENDVNLRAIPAGPLELPADPEYQREWYLHESVRHPDFDPRSSTRCEAAWRLLDGFGSPAVVIGISDAGCRLDHPDFDGPGKFAGWGYFQGTRLVRDTDPDARPERMYDPGENHGTACAGLAAGEADATHTVGAAPGCRLLPVSWQSADGYLFVSDSKLLTLLDFVAERVDVLLNPWGRTPCSLYSSFVTRRVEELALRGGRRGRGILFVWAAGNDNCPVRHRGSVPVPYTHGWKRRGEGGWEWVGVKRSRHFENTLVGLPAVALVAGVGSTAQRAHYSNYGTGITLTAPAHNVHTYYRAEVRGLEMAAATGEPVGVSHKFIGTSGAAALTAGVAALVISANPDLAAVQVLSLLKRTASRDLNATPYPRTPPSRVDPDTSWDVSPVPPFADPAFRDTGDPDGSWSPWFGHGRVDALAAVREALPRPGPGEAGTVSEHRSEPALPIPDENPRGVRDALFVGERGRLVSVRVGVEIVHSWIGDLVVTLVAPDGREVVLHDRAGGGAERIQRVYDAEAAPGLLELRDAPMHGTWTLRVQDRARHDVGMLRRWTLSLTSTAEPLRAVDVAGARIARGDPAGTLRSVELPEAPPVREVAVAVDLSHGAAEGLELSLHPPEGEPVALPLGRLPDGDRIVRRWASQEEPGLQRLRGLPPGGTWTLRVVDRGGEGAGKLNRWEVEVTP